jgi:hypothetical protein
MNALFVAWRGGEAQSGAWGPVGRLEHDGRLFRFCYTRGAQTLPNFRPFAQMENLHQVYESEELFPLFANRLLSSSRPEYEAFLRWGGFDPSNPPDPIAVLGVTEGIRQTDSVEVFPCPIPGADGCYVGKFFLHGVRWMSPAGLECINQLQHGDTLRIEREPTNPSDANAIAVFPSDSKTQIGYVPRYLARDVGKLLHGCDPEFVGLFVEKINRDAPLQHRVLCRMHACWPEIFVPCSGDDFVPIPAGVPAHCHS